MEGTNERLVKTNSSVSLPSGLAGLRLQPMAASRTMTPNDFDIGAIVQPRDKAANADTVSVIAEDLENHPVVVRGRRGRRRAGAETGTLFRRCWIRSIS